MKRRQFLGAAAGAVAATAAEQTPTKPRLKIGQIGVGHPHASKLAVYRRSPDYEVVGVVEPHETLRRRAETNEVYRGLPWLTRDQLLATPGLRAVLVESQVRDLLDHGLACVTAGIPIHLDKPAGESLPTFKRLLEAASQRKLLVQMGYMFRYNPAIVLLREFLRQGWLGEVFEVHAVMSKVYGPALRKEFAPYPGGVLFDLGGHLMDLVVGVLGKPTRVTPYPRQSSRVGDGFVDNMLAVLEYPRATATVKSSGIEVEGSDRRHLVVCGTEGTFHIQPLDNPSARVALSQARGDYRKGYQDLRFPRYERYVADAQDMARILRGEKASDFSYEHDLAVQEALLQACGLPTDR